MSTRTKSYPNPVLGNGDDYRITIGEESLTFSDIEKDNSFFYFRITLNLEDEIIDNLIKEEKAAFFCDIDCVKTNYRTSIWAYDKQLEITIPRNKVVDTVDLNCYIVAMKPIDSYTHPCFNEIYEGITFSLEEGDFIALLGSFFFNATVTYRKCPAPSSLMQVQEAKPDSGITKITFVEDQERIFIVMPHDLFETYVRVCGQNTNADNLFVSSVAVEALSHALMKVRNESTNLAENLRNLLEKNNIIIEDDKPEQCIDAARKLLEEDGVDPYSTFMKQVDAVITKPKADQDGSAV